MQRKLVIAGTILVDAIKTIDVYPDAGKLVQIRSISQSVGGAVPNTAINLAKLDPTFPVKVFGKVGEDAYGSFVVEEMRKVGLDTSAMLYSKTAPTSFTDVMSVAGGERTFFTMPGANTELTVEDFDFDTLAPSHLHLAYLLLLDALDSPDPTYGSCAARLLAGAKARGITTSLDVISEPSDRYLRVVVPALPYVDYLIINEVEAAKIAGVEVTENGKPTVAGVRAAAQRLLELGVQKKVILHCPDMGIALDRDGSFTVVPSLCLPKGYIVGATGAGDTFCAGTLYALLKGYSDEQLLKLASLCAACNLSAADSISGMRPLAEVEKLENLYQRKENVC